MSAELDVTSLCKFKMPSSFLVMFARLLAMPASLDLMSICIVPMATSWLARVAVWFAVSLWRVMMSPSLLTILARLVWILASLVATSSIIF